MDQGISAAPSAPSHALRLVLIFFGAVLGFLVLSFVFGSSSASADDGDGLLPGVGELVESTVQTTVQTTTTAAHTVQAVTQAAPAAAVTKPVAAVADTAVSAVAEPTGLDEAIGSTPVESLLTPVTKVIDDTLAGVGDSVGPVAGVIATVASSPADVTAAAAIASTVAVTHDLISGVAGGALDLNGSAPAPGDAGLSGVASAGGGLAAALAAAGFFVLLVLRRQSLTARAMPGSPVYETDSSPD